MMQEHFNKKKYLICLFVERFSHIFSRCFDDTERIFISSRCHMAPLGNSPEPIIKSEQRDESLHRHYICIRHNRSVSEVSLDRKIGRTRPLSLSLFSTSRLCVPSCGNEWQRSLDKDGPKTLPFSRLDFVSTIRDLSSKFDTMAYCCCLHWGWRYGRSSRKRKM